MGRILAGHIDDAPWVLGDPRVPGGPPSKGTQFFGDNKEGPWVLVPSCPPNDVIDPHTHDRAELIYIVEGGIEFGGQSYGPGNLVYIEAGTEYGFKVGPEGVRFLNVRDGPANTVKGGKVIQHWDEEGPHLRGA